MRGGRDVGIGYRSSSSGGSVDRDRQLEMVTRAPRSPKIP